MKVAMTTTQRYMGYLRFYMVPGWQAAFLFDFVTS